MDRPEPNPPHINPLRPYFPFSGQADYVKGLERDISLARMMIAQALLEKAVGRSQLPQFAFFGSGVLVAHGIDLNRQIGDIDIFVTKTLFSMLRDEPRWEFKLPLDDDHHRNDPPYLELDIIGLKAHAFYAWREREGEKYQVEAQDAIRESTVVNGLRCVPIERVHQAKLNTDRVKDEPDIRAIEDYLEARLVKETVADCDIR